MDTSGADVWGSFRDHRAGEGFTVLSTLKSPVLVPSGRAGSPSVYPALPLTSIFVNNKSICTGSGMSTGAPVDQGWFIPCVKKRKGTIGTTKKKAPELSCASREPL